MTKIILSLVFLLSSLSAELINAYLSQEILNSKTPIVDVRTPREWKETAISKGGIVFAETKNLPIVPYK